MPIINISDVQEHLQAATLDLIPSNAHLKVHLGNNSLPFSFSPFFFFVIACGRQSLICCGHKAWDLGGLMFPAMQSEISEVGGNDVDLKTNTQAHILNPGS